MSGLDNLKKKNDIKKDIKKQEQIRTLKNCFSAGYSMPQFCVDFNYNKPLFICDDIELICQIHGQFEFDKRIIPTFRSFSISLKSPIRSRPFNNVRLLNINEINVDEIEELFDEHDVVFIIDNNKYYFPKEKTVYLNELVNRIGNYVFFTRPLIEYKKRHPGVKIVLMDFPVLNPSEAETNEEKRASSRSIVELSKKLKNDYDAVEFQEFMELGYSKEETLKLFQYQPAFQNADGSTSLRDNPDEIWNIKDGVRKTAFQEDNDYKKKMWCIGNCVLLGVMSSYKKTFESYLQELFNQNGEDICVMNVAQFCSQRYQDNLYNLERIPIKSGDIVLFGVDGIHSSDDFPFFSVKDMFAPPNNYGNVFVDGVHINENGYRIMANKFYEWFKRQDNLDVNNDVPEFSEIHYYGIPQTHVLMGGWIKKYNIIKKPYYPIVYKLVV